LIADIVVAAVLLISGVLALFRGFVKETLTIAGWIGAIFITLYGYQHVAPLLKDVVAESWIAEVIAASTLFLISLVILTVVSHLIASKVQGSMLGHLDRALGFVFGLVRGMALISLVYLGATLFWDENNLPEPIRNARSLPLVKAGADLLASLAPANTFPGRGDPTDQIGGAVDDIRNGVKDAAKDKLNEMIDQMDTEETLRRLNTPEPATPPPPSEPESSQTSPPGGQPADALPAPPGYQDQERQDMQRLIESNQ
jgi:membrane protein required for colicin V production